MTPARAPCVIPGCPNSSAKWAGHRYICSTHWRGVPRGLRRRRTRILAILRKRGELEVSADGKQWIAPYKGRRALWAVWRLMERAAIRAAAGL